MGLDMYLYRVPKVDTTDELTEINTRLDKAFIDGTLSEELKAIKKQKNYIYDIDFNLSSYIDIEEYQKDPEGWGNIIELNIRVAYWRKFNALHKWFVDNVQNGVDDCGDYIVTKEHLLKLNDTLRDINKENADKLLPSQSGFFFGGTEYDEYYWQEIAELKAVVTYLLTQRITDTNYIYHSSW